MITKEARIELIKELGQYLIDHAESIIPGAYPDLTGQTLILNLEPAGGRTFKLINSYSYGTEYEDVKLKKESV